MKISLKTAMLRMEHLEKCAEHASYSNPGHVHFWRGVALGYYEARKILELVKPTKKTTRQGKASSK